MNPNTRIKLHMTIQDVARVMSDGNIGALSVLARLLKEGDAIDLAAAMGGGFATILALDSLGVYGPGIWILYKDVCEQNLEKFMGLLRAWQLGLVEEKKLLDLVKTGYSPRQEAITFNVVELLTQVKTQLGGEWVSPT
jgi:hypothetical protein